MKQNIVKWLNSCVGNDKEANYLRLLALLKEISKLEKYDAIICLRDMLTDVEIEHQNYFDDFEYLYHIKLGKCVLRKCRDYVLRNEKINFDSFVKEEHWKNIKIESPTAV